MNNKVFPLAMLALIGVILISGIPNILMGDITPIYQILAIIFFLVIPYGVKPGFYAIVLFQLSPFQVPLPTDPQLAQLGSFILIAGGFIALLTRKQPIYSDRLIRFVFFTLAVFIFMYVLNIMALGIPIGKLLNNTGGRHYIKGILLCFTPFFVLYAEMSIPKFIKLLRIGFLLAMLGVINDILFYTAPGALAYTSIFLQNVTDQANFSSSYEEGKGALRLPGVSDLGLGLGLYLLSSNALLRGRGMKKTLTFLLILLCVGLFMLSGYRRYAFMIPIAMYFFNYAKTRNFIGAGVGVVLKFSLIIILTLGIMYTFYAHLPSSFKRIVCNIEFFINHPEFEDFSDTRANDSGRELVTSSAMAYTKEYWLFGTGLIDRSGRIETYSFDRPEDIRHDRRMFQQGLLGLVTNFGIVGIFTGILTLAMMTILSFKTIMLFHGQRQIATTIGMYISFVYFGITCYLLAHGNSHNFVYLTVGFTSPILWLYAAGMREKRLLQNSEPKEDAPIRLSA